MNVSGWAEKIARRWAAHTVYLTGAGLALLGVVVLWGWCLRIPVLLQLRPGYVPMGFYTSICFASCGVSLLCLMLKRTPEARVGGLFTCTVGLLFLAEYALQTDLGIDQALMSWPGPIQTQRFPGRMAAPTAICFTLAGLAIWLAARKTRKSWRSAVNGAAAAVTAGLGSMAVVGYFTGLSETYVWGNFAGMALHTAIGMMALGAAIVAHEIHMTERNELWEQRWVSLAAVVMVAVATVVLIQALTSRDHAQLSRTAAEHVGHLEGHLRRVFDSQAHVVAELAESPGLAGGDARPNDLRVHALPGQGGSTLVRYDAQGEMLSTILPSNPHFASSPEQIAAGGARDVLERARGAREPVVFWTRAAGGSTPAVTMLLPVVREGEFAGWLMALQPFKAMIAQFEAETPRNGFFVSLWQGDKLLMRTGPDSATPYDLMLDVELPFLSEGVRVTVQPTAEFAAASSNRLSWIVAMMGVFLGTTLVLSIRTAQHAWKQADALANANSELTREMAERAFSDARFRAVTEAAGDAIIIIDNQGIIQSWNKAAEKIFGYAANEAIGHSVELIMPERFRALHADSLQTFGRPHSRVGAGPMELTGCRRDGTEFPVEISLAEWVLGEQRYLSGILRDITGRKKSELEVQRARDQALEASRLKSEFLATMSHEIRTPMNGIIGMSAMLLETTLDPKQREMGNVVHRSAGHLLDIINDILDFSKIESGKMRLECVPFNPRNIIEAVAAMLSGDARRKGLQLICEFEGPADCLLDGDPGRIQQIATNLVGNAIKFTEQGEVRLRLCCKEVVGGRQEIRVEVKDTGIGISPKVREKLFQPFTQGDGSTTRRFGGTGLGLAICRQLVGLMGGKIDCESTEGAGSLFWYELTLATSATVSAAPRSVRGAISNAAPAVVATTPPAPNGALRLLLVEDNASNQMVATMMLGFQNHRVDVVGNGVEAIAKLSVDSKYDAILMDCQMPEMDGYETTRRIRTGEIKGLNPRIPIVALTAFAMASDRAKCLAAGMDDYVSKPIQTAALNAAFVRCGLRRSAGPAEAAAGLPGTGDELPTLDLEHMQQLQSLPGRDGRNAAQLVAEVFVKEMPERLRGMALHLGEQNGHQLERAAHTLAGSCASLGARRLRHLLADLEAAAREGAWTRASARFGAIQEADAELMNELKLHGLL